MGGLTFYSMYLNDVAQTPNEDWRETQQAFIEEMFDNSTIVKTDVYEEGYPFDFKFVNNPECWVGTVIDVTTGMTKDSDDYRSLYFKEISHDVGRGRYFKWNDNYWIVYETTTPELETISTCNIRRCNNWLKWVTDKGEVISYPCVIEGELTSANAQVAKSITQANSHINVIVQGNPDTIKITKNMRFMFNRQVYKFYAINNYMQTDYVDDNTPLLFMDFYLDMEIDEDNVAENLADDLRKQFRVECDIEQLSGNVGTQGVLTTVAYRNNTILDNPRMEYFSTDEDVITIDDYGNYYMIGNGTASIGVRILGNEYSLCTIPVLVDDVLPTSYTLVISPNVKSLRQGLSVTITAKILDSLNNEMIDSVTCVESGTDGHNNYSLIYEGNNEWTLTNNLKSKLPLTLKFSNTLYNVESTMDIQLKAMY